MTRHAGRASFGDAPKRRTRRAGRSAGGSFGSRRGFKSRRNRQRGRAAAVRGRSSRGTARLSISSVDAVKTGAGAIDRVASTTRGHRSGLLRSRHTGHGERSIAVTDRSEWVPRTRRVYTRQSRTTRTLVSDCRSERCGAHEGTTLARAHTHTYTHTTRGSVCSSLGTVHLW